MRIGNIIETQQSETKHVKTATNYSKAENLGSIRLDITDIGKDTGFIIDQGRSMQDVIDEAGALDVQTRQDYMTVMSNTMSEEDYAKMCKDGYKPSEMSGEESVTILDHIKAVMAQSGEVVAGFNDNVDIEKLKEITGNTADANALSNAMKKADIPQTDVNAKKIHDAAKEIQEIDELKENGIQFMITNRLEPTIDNIYMANFSVSNVERTASRGYYALGMQGYLAQKADAGNVDDVLSDIEKAVEKFDIEDIDYDIQIKEAKWLVEKGIDLTQDNIEKLDQLMNIKLPLKYEEAVQKAAFSIAKGKEPKDADISQKEDNFYEEAVGLKEKTEEITDNQIKNVILEGKKLTIKNIWVASNSENSVSDSNQQFIQGRAALEEIRLRMTLDVNVSLLKRGIELDTMSLSNLVEALKEGQKQINESLFGASEEKTLEVKASLFNTTKQAVEDIPFMPAAVIGRLKVEESYSLTKVHEIGTDLKAQYEAAGQKYETLMTAPRRDMGDSISKAFRNVDDILSEIGLEKNKENAKAVRILGYNSMEINAGEVVRIREATAQVMDVVNNLTPARTLELIRKGINPMEMSVDELSDELRRMDVKESDEKYSRFLYKLEKSNEITSSEREAYIGIYRLVHRLEKTDGASIGALVNGERELTLGNLLSGMRSKGVRFNEKIDDNYGFLQETVKKGVSISDQIEQAFAGRIGQDSNSKLEQQYIKESYEEYKEIINDSKNTVMALNEESESVTADNIAAYEALNSAENNVFALLRKYSKNIDKEEKSGYEDYKNKAEELVDRFEDEDTAKNAYASMVKAGVSMLEEYQYAVDSTLDLKQIKLCNKQLTQALKRSSQERYTVPMEINGEVTAINLTIKHGSSKGVDASFVDDRFGQVTAHFSIEDERIKGMVVSESKDGQEHIKGVIARMETKTAYAMDVNVIVGKETQNNHVENGNDFEKAADINNVDTTSLYKLAKSFLVEYSLRA